MKKKVFSEYFVKILFICYFRRKLIMKIGPKKYFMKHAVEHIQLHCRRCRPAHARKCRRRRPAQRRSAEGAVQHSQEVPQAPSSTAKKRRRRRPAQPRSAAGAVQHSQGVIHCTEGRKESHQNGSRKLTWRARP